MIIRSKAPLRISLAGGGTDLRDYSDLHGGAVLNATIGMHAYCNIVPRRDDTIVLRSVDRNESKPTASSTSTATSISPKVSTTAL
jgi:D-glycero-alpha-D-manno-heptose-7-phosphate kinase